MTLPEATTNPAPTTWKGVKELERAYRLSHGQIRNWIKKGLIPPSSIIEPTKPSEKRLIDDATINTIVIDQHRPRGPKLTREVIINLPDNSLQVIPPQFVSPSSPLIQSAPADLPPGITATAELVTDYLRQRGLQVERGQISPRTYEIEERYMSNWARHAPVFPWGPLDIDSYEAELGNKPSRHHAIRYLKTLSIWANDRYPEAKLPIKFHTGTQKPPRHDVLTRAQETYILTQLEARSPRMWVLATIANRTGCRPFELSDLDWEDLTPKGFATKGRAKKTAGTVYFPPGLYDFILANLPEPHTGPVFPYSHGKRFRGGSLATTFRNVVVHFRPPDYKGPLGPNMFRHLHAERLKNLMPTERAASILRTSVKMLEQTYGKHPDDSYQAIIDSVDETIFASPPVATPSPSTGQGGDSGG